MKLFWIIYLVNLLIPVISLPFGICFYKGKLIKTNRYLGYFIQREYNDKKSFQSANKLLGKYVIIFSAVMLTISGLLTLIFMNMAETVVVAVAIIIMVLEFFEIILPMIIVEINLYKQKKNKTAD